jgi:ABC-type antimicrobial peptide transport system permease subunit
MGLHIQVDALTAAVVLSVAIGIGLASTLVPAYRASRMSIADALRYVG